MEVSDDQVGWDDRMIYLQLVIGAVFVGIIFQEECANKKKTSEGERTKCIVSLNSTY